MPVYTYGECTFIEWARGIADVPQTSTILGLLENDPLLFVKQLFCSVCVCIYIANIV